MHKIGQTHSLTQAINAKRENRIGWNHSTFLVTYTKWFENRKKKDLFRVKCTQFFKQSILTWTSFSFSLYSLFYCSMFSLIFVFVFGGFLSQIVTDLSKLTVGRLRPSFMAACKANLTGPSCQGYVTRDVCTGDLFEIKLARYETMWLLWSKTRELPCQEPCYQRPLFHDIKVEVSVISWAKGRGWYHLPSPRLFRISQKPNLIIVLKKITTNTPSQGTWIDNIGIGNHALHAQPTQISQLSASRSN